MTDTPQYRIKQNSGPGGIEAIYGAQIPLPGTGTYTVLALTKAASGFIGAPSEVAVAPSSAIPNDGERPPAVATDPPASVHGNQSRLTTRDPPEDLPAVSFDNAHDTRAVVHLV